MTQLLNIFLILLQAQENAGMVDEMNTSKFIVPVFVIAIIFVGILAYLVMLDLRLRKLEDKK